MTGTLTPLSINEVKFFFIRAAVGAGAPFGLGEEFAKAALWLAAKNADPADLAAPALQSLAEGSSSGTISSARSRDSAMRFVGEKGAPLSVLYAGPSIADEISLAVAQDEELQLVVEKIDQPALVAAYLATADIAGAAIAVCWSGILGETNRVEFSPDGICTFTETSRPFHPVDKPVDVIVTRVKTTDSSHSTAQSPTASRNILKDGIDVGAAPWAIVHGYFRKCLVPSSQQSREQGAGAGLTDND